MHLIAVIQLMVLYVWKNINYLNHDKGKCVRNWARSPSDPGNRFGLSHNPAIKIKLSRRAKEGILASRKAVEKWLLLTKLCMASLRGLETLKIRQFPNLTPKSFKKNLIRSHVVGVGEPFSLATS